MRLKKVVIAVLAALALVSCNRDPKVVAQRYLETGNRYFEKGRIKEARLMYIRAKQKDLRFGEAYYRLGLAELKLGSYGPAAQAFQRAIELILPPRPERTDAMVKISDIYLVAAHEERDASTQKQYLDDVSRWSAELVKRDPNSFDGHRLIGDLNLAKSILAAKVAEREQAAELLESAIAEYQKAEAIKPGTIAIAMQLARSYAAKGDHAGAQRLYLQVLDKDKSYAPAYMELYRIYLSDKKADEGEQLMKLAIQNNPKEVGYLTTLAMQYSFQKRRTDMVGALEQLKGHVKDYPDAYIMAGDFYYRMGDADAAIQEYNQGIAKDPQRKLVYQKHIIEVMLEQGRRNEAAELNAKILKEFPKDADARGLLASFALDRGEVAKAVTDLQSVIMAAPDNPVARFNLGRAYAAKGDWEQARQSFNKAVEIKPDYMLPRLALAKLQLSRGEFDASLKSAQTILAKYDNTNGTAQLVLSASLVGQKKFAEARMLLDAMTKTNPSVPEVFLQMGILDLTEKKYAEAATAFRKSYELNPSDSRGLLGEARAYMAENKGAEALQRLQAESGKSPNRADLHLAVANGALDYGAYDVSIEQYQKALETVDRNSKIRAGTYLRLGEAYRRKGDYNNAIANMQKAREIMPDDSLVLTNLGSVLNEAGRTSESRQVYEAALKLDPDNGIVLNNLAYQMAEHGGDLNEALTKALRAKQLLPNMREVSDTLGWVYLKKGLNDNAIDIFRELVEKVPAHPMFRYHLGLAFYQKGNKPQAAKELRESLKCNPPKDEREKIQQLLGKLTGA